MKKINSVFFLCLIACATVQIDCYAKTEDDPQTKEQSIKDRILSYKKTICILGVIFLGGIYLLKKTKSSADQS